MAGYLLLKWEKVAEPVGLPIRGTSNLKKKRDICRVSLGDLQIAHPFLGSDFWKVAVSRCPAIWTGTVCMGFTNIIYFYVSIFRRIMR